MMKVDKEMLQEDDLQRLIRKHHEAVGHWREGKAVSMFYQDGLPCVKYESGSWWHYDVDAGVWF